MCPESRCMPVTETRTQPDMPTCRASNPSGSIFLECLLLRLKRTLGERFTTNHSKRSSGYYALLRDTSCRCQVPQKVLATRSKDSGGSA